VPQYQTHRESRDLERDEEPDEIGPGESEGVPDCATPSRNQRGKSDRSDPCGPARRGLRHHPVPDRVHANEVQVFTEPHIDG
jgi:hypothetical protein